MKAVEVSLVSLVICNIVYNMCRHSYCLLCILAGHHSSKDVIDAYRNSCLRLRIKPCDKLIKQLEVSHYSMLVFCLVQLLTVKVWLLFVKL